MRLIDAEDIASEIEKYYEPIDEDHPMTLTVDQINEVTLNMPFFDPVKQSTWKYYRKENKAVCMNCSFERDLDVDFGESISCPNCGARMDGKE